MKKLVAMLSGIAATSALFASPVLSPDLPALYNDGVFFCDPCSCWSLRAGFRGDYVWNRHLENVDTFQIFANEGVLTLNLWDRVDVYGLVGAASQNFTTNTATGHYDTAQFETSTIWGVGIRGILWETCWGCWGTTYFGIDGNYEQITSSHERGVTHDGSNVRTAGLYDQDQHYREWQVSLQMGQKICLLTPYVAIKWSSARANIASFDGATNSHRHFGYAVGTTLADAGRMSITAEARFVDEKAATINAEFRF